MPLVGDGDESVRADEVAAEQVRSTPRPLLSIVVLVRLDNELLARSPRDPHCVANFYRLASKLCDIDNVLIGCRAAVSDVHRLGPMELDDRKVLAVAIDSPVTNKVADPEPVDLVNIHIFGK